MFNEKTKTIVKYIIYVLSGLAAALGVFFGVTACNVTRNITTQSQYVQKGDTSVVIQTKTIESYNAIKNN